MHLTFTAQCGTKLDHSEKPRPVRHPIHIFTASPSGSFQHALWALSPLKCCSWHQPAKLACKLAATPKRENNLLLWPKTHHSLFICMPGREYFIVNVWLTIMLQNNDWKHIRMTIISEVDCFLFCEKVEFTKGFKWMRGLTGNGGTVHFSCEMGQENLMRVNHRVWHALWTWSAAKKKSLLLYQAHSSQLWEKIRLQKNATAFPDNILKNLRKMLLQKKRNSGPDKKPNYPYCTWSNVYDWGQKVQHKIGFSNISPLQHQIDGTVWVACENRKQVLPWA